VRRHVCGGQAQPEPDLLALAEGWARGDEPWEVGAGRGAARAAEAAAGAALRAHAPAHLLLRHRMRPFRRRPPTHRPPPAAPAAQVTRSSPRPALLRAFLDQQQYSNESIS
jgi:hypothetical protein